MTRVSDRPGFARSVADAGALPFLALAMMSGDEVRGLLREASERLAGRSWGVGLLGFLEPELRRAQTEAILEVKPPFALIAGGRPDQAKDFEQAGIPSYLHVPSPGLLNQFLRDGARRFVLEGRECGGHVGPRSSFVLWEQAGRVLIEAVEQGIEPTEIHLLYAGGIHDARSASVVAAIAAPLAERGVKTGVLIGTAYLFTREAVETGAIVEGFQREAQKCETTVLLETGPGHLVRVSPTPFAEKFAAERRELIREGRTAEEIQASLESLNVGRLRVAAKGVERPGQGGSLSAVDSENQRERGLYMLGQAATLRRDLTTIAELHREISRPKADLPSQERRPRLRRRPRPSDVAIIGMAAIVPGATEVRRFWENTLRGHDAITEVPAERWDWREYYDADPKAPDKIVSRWGGFVPEIPFDPLQYGMPPASLPSIEPLHLLTLDVVRSALDDAGYRVRPFDRERTAVVLGAGGGAAQLAMGYAFRSYLPMLDTVIPGAGTDALARCGKLLPEWTEDSFPGILLNVAAGRIANRFDLGGANYTVDAACGSSLAAAAAAVRELESGAADMVVLGGVDTVQNPFTYLAFSKTHAFSPRGRCRPFDASADGIVISEGVAVVILKRLADAERDGDRIYSVIKGMGASSDGREKSLTAPRYEGQVRALRRAYDKAGISPATVGYVEAHGTGTAAGDLAEVNALKHVFGEAGTTPNHCALGSVKSLVGHTKCAAGLVGLINASLALYHRVLPPTIGIETPNPKAGFAASPFHLSTRARPWAGASAAHPRRAGVSAFGFGGTNFHAVLEGYGDDPSPRRSPVLDWPSELFLWRAADRSKLTSLVDRFEQALANVPIPALRDLAHATIRAASKPGEGPRLAIVANSPDDLREKLSRSSKMMVSGAAESLDPSGIAFAESGRWAKARVAFLFPGQGSQSPGMLEEVSLLFPEIIDAFDAFDKALTGRGRPPVGPKVFPPPARDDDEFERQKQELASPEVSQPAIGAASLGLLQILSNLGLEPRALAGHSYGEIVALHAAGVFSRDALAELSEARGRFLIEAVGEEPGTMLAVQAGPADLDSLIREIPGVSIANLNGPSQSVLSGSSDGIARARVAVDERGYRALALTVACGFHSPLVFGAKKPLIELATQLVEQAPSRPVYSNVTAAPYSQESGIIAGQLGDHLASPVRFSAMIETMFDDGARVFVEVGPGSVLTGLVGSILKDRSHLAVACEPAGKKGVAGLLATLGRLFVAGVPLDLRPLTADRSTKRVSLSGDRFDLDEPRLSPSTWMVDGNRARPAFGPEPARFGPGPALPRPDPSASASLAQKNGHAPAPSQNGHPIPLVNGHASHQPDAVIAAFQQTMQSFLDVQRSTMLGYLGSGRTPSRAPVHPFVEPPSRNGHRSEPFVPKTADPVANGHVQTKPIDSEVGEAFDIERRLLAIVRDRTGYPSEMLKLDLDLEADLGIDSIKRVEILGTLRDALPAGRNGSESDLMDQLARARTLGAIVERVSRHLGPIPAPKVAANGHAETVKAVQSSVRRMLLEPVDVPIPSRKRLSSGLVLITDDQRGVAAATAARLNAAGYQTVRVVSETTTGASLEPGVRGVDLTSPDSVSRLVETLRLEGRLVGIVHALPLRHAASAGLDPKVWNERLAVEVRGLFLLAKACAEDLARASGQGGASLVAATGMGGGFASFLETPDDFFAGHGAIAGLVKTLAREWEGVRGRVVDFDPTEPADLLGDLLADELMADDSLAEVGYRQGRRIALHVVESPLPDFSTMPLTVQPGEPILITGGARGITAAVAADLARRWRPTLLLVGTSAQPDGDEAPDIAGILAPTELKAKLLERLGRSGRKVSPTELERTYQGVCRDREIRANLRTLRELGATVEYARADVRDAEALRAVLEDWRLRFGPPVGLIHGAGVIQDKLLRDKTPESFDRVIGTKLDGALTLARLIDPEPLRFAAFFSSVAGRFGNRGQADYAAANEALNKLAVWLDRRWSGRVVSMIWGPWSGVGMVSDLEMHLGRQGFGLIPPEAGRTRLGDELIYGTKGDVEVIVAGDLGDLVAPTEALRKS